MTTSAVIASRPGILSMPRPFIINHSESIRLIHSLFPAHRLRDVSSGVLINNNIDILYIHRSDNDRKDDFYIVEVIGTEKRFFCGPNFNYDRHTWENGIRITTTFVEHNRITPTLAAKMKILEYHRGAYVDTLEDAIHLCRRWKIDRYSLIPKERNAPYIWIRLPEPIRPHYFNQEN